MIIHITPDEFEPEFQDPWKQDLIKSPMIDYATNAIHGWFEGKNVIIFDDLGDTLGTLCKATDLLLENGALSVRGVLTHPVMSGNALERLSNSKMNELIVSDSIPNIYDKIKIYNHLINLFKKCQK